MLAHCKKAVSFVVVASIAILPCNGQKPFSRQLCLEYLDGNTKEKATPDTFFVCQYKNGKLMQQITRDSANGFLVKQDLTFNDPGKEMTVTTEVYKSGNLVLNEKKIGDVRSRAVIKSYDLLDGSAETAILERDMAGRIIKTIKERTYSYVTISYPNDSTIVHRYYDHTRGDLFFKYDSLTRIHERDLQNTLTIDLQERKVTIRQFRYKDQLNVIGGKTMSAEMTPLDKSESYSLSVDQLFNKLCQMIPLVKTEQEWAASTFNKDGSVATGTRKKYDENGQVKTYTLKFVYE